MTAYPKHYLADVPHDLRMRVLDLCIHRQWHDALDLLHQHGFTQYEWWEVVWFHDHAPTNLEPRSADSLSASAGALPISPNPEPRTENSEPGTANLNTALPSSSAPSVLEAPPDLESLTPLRELRASVVKPCRPRSKIARLPADVRDNLNTMLASGRPYREIIQWLKDSGYCGFNKVNLHNWRITGFQVWLRTIHPTIQLSTDPGPPGFSEQIDLGLNPSARSVPTVL